MKKIYLIGQSVKDKISKSKIDRHEFICVGYSDKDLNELGYFKENSSSTFCNSNGDTIKMAFRKLKNSDGKVSIEYPNSVSIIEEYINSRLITVNSIIIDAESEDIIDKYNGIPDIENKIIRQVPQSLKDNPIDVLRIAKYYSALDGYTISDDTIVSCKSLKKYLKNVSKDDSIKQLMKSLTYSGSYKFIEFLDEIEFLSELFPYINELKFSNKKTYSVTFGKVNTGVLFDYILSVLKETPDLTPTEKFIILYSNFINKESQREQFYFINDSLYNLCLQFSQFKKALFNMNKYNDYNYAILSFLSNSNVKNLKIEEFNFNLNLLRLYYKLNNNKSHKLEKIRVIFTKFKKEFNISKEIGLYRKKHGKIPTTNKIQVIIKEELRRIIKKI